MSTYFYSSKKQKLLCQTSPKNVTKTTAYPNVKKGQFTLRLRQITFIKCLSKLSMHLITYISGVLNKKRVWSEFLEAWLGQNLHVELIDCININTIFTRVEVDPPFWSQKISFFYFWLKILLKNLSFISEFSFRSRWLHEKFVLNFF